MIYEFPYIQFDSISKISIPDDVSTSIYNVPSVLNVKSNIKEIIERSLQNPIGADKLVNYLERSESVLIIVDDMSRPTPVREILDVILKEISRAMIDTSNISILIALGTHRKMTKTEIEQRFGTEISKKYYIKNHEWNNPSELYNYGKLEDGTNVVLNKAMREFDFVIGIGSIAPHPAAGFSGGGKIITPGVATDDAAGDFHWQSVQYPQNEVLGVRENPMRKKIDEIARVGNLNYIVNVIMDGNNRVVDAVCGDPVEAHKVGARKSLEIVGVSIINPKDADIFIIDTHPLDQDLWQGVKALCALECIVPDNSIAIIVSPLKEGVCSSHPEVLNYGFQPLDKIIPLVESGKISKVVGHNLVQGGRLLARVKCFLASPGISKEEANKMGFEYFSTAQDAVDAAIKIKGKNSKIIILRTGGEIAPICKNIA